MAAEILEFNVLRVLGRKTSNNVQKVLWLLDELGISYLQEDYGGSYGKTTTPEYLAINPHGTVPTIIENNLVLWESNTILRYLARDASGIYPENVMQRAHVDKWLDWQLGTLSPAFRPLYIGVVRDGKQGSDLQQLHENAKRLFRLLDSILADYNYIGSEDLTLADIAIGPMIYRWFTLQFNESDTTHLQAFLDRLTTRSAFQKNICEITLA